MHSSRLCLPSLAAAVFFTGCSVPEVGWRQTPPPSDVDSQIPDYEPFEGVVFDPDGAPISPAYLTTQPRGHGAETDVDGAFTFTRLPPGNYRLVVAAPGFETREFTPLLGAWPEYMEIELQPAARVDGVVQVQVQGPDGQPRAGARVTDSTGQSLTTDVDGLAFLEGLGGQVVDLLVADPTGLWTRSVSDVSVPQLGAAQVVVQLSGRPLDGARVVGSAPCQSCHATFADAVASSAHGRTLSDTVEPPLLDLFEADTRITLLAGASATLTVQLSVPTVILESTAGATRTYPVDGLLGDQRQGSVPYTILGAQAYPLPVGWVAQSDEGGAWPGAQARVVPWEVQRWFNTNGNFKFPVASSPAPSSSAEALCFACHATGFTVSARGDGGVDMSDPAGTGARWTEPGVGCERCHGPASSHLEARFANKALAITNPAKLDLDRANEVCGQCHAATQGIGTGTPYPWSDQAGLFHPGATLGFYGDSVPVTWPSGAAAAPGQQADELALSPHRGNGAYDLRCFDCHDPHGTAGLPSLLRLDARDNTLCSSCHLARTWSDDPQALQAHDGHGTYDPSASDQQGRCVGCHMPRSAARVAFNDASGGGDLASHLFTAQAPQETLDWFDAQGVGSLPVGSFPVHGCGECHELGAWLATQAGTTFPGASGDPTSRATHQTHQTDYTGVFP